MLGDPRGHHPRAYRSRSRGATAPQEGAAAPGAPHAWSTGRPRAPGAKAKGGASAAAAERTTVGNAAPRRAARTQGCAGPPDPRPPGTTHAGAGRFLRDQVFFLLRTALKDRPKGPSTANRQLPSTANGHQPPTTNRHQPPPTASGDQPPTANRCQPPPNTNHQPQPPVANCQPPTAATRQPPTASNHG